MCLFTAVPLFNTALVTEAYLLRRQSLEAPLFPYLTGSDFHTVSSGKLLLVPTTEAELLNEDLDKCDPRLIVPLLNTPPTGEIADKLRDKGIGYAVKDSASHGARYCLLEWSSLPAEGRAAYLQERIADKNVAVVVMGLEDWGSAKTAIKEKYSLLEGRFYLLPDGPAKDIDEDEDDDSAAITPLKSNLLRLINTVRDEACEFSEVAELVRQDPALTVSLMRLINSPYIGVRNRVKSIPQAVTLLGQVEVRKWIATAVFKFIGSDRPDELTRSSLLRAKFTENLAPLFGLQSVSDSLFLLGLFSALDGILGIPMKSALRLVPMHAYLLSALLDCAGPYAPILQFLLSYESGRWETVGEIAEKHQIPDEDVLKAYLEALAWYGDLLE